MWVYVRLLSSPPVAKLLPWLSRKMEGKNATEFQHVTQRINMDEVVAEADHSDADRSSRSVYTALSIIGVAYFFSFVCYGGTDGLQPASEADLPRACVTAVICLASIASSVLLAPAVFVSRLSPNMALCVAWGSHALYAMANLYPSAGTLLPTAVVVGVTFPAIAVAHGVYTTALVDRWCQCQGVGGEEEMRLADVDRGDRSHRHLESNCGCTRRTTDDNLRRQNAFVMFNAILLVCLNIHS